jgi:hypothetical protein
MVLTRNAFFLISSIASSSFGSNLAFDIDVNNNDSTLGYL